MYTFKFELLWVKDIEYYISKILLYCVILVWF